MSEVLKALRKLVASAAAAIKDPDAFIIRDTRTGLIQRLPPFAGERICAQCNLNAWHALVAPAPVEGMNSIVALFCSGCGYGSPVEDGMIEHNPIEDEDEVEL